MKIAVTAQGNGLEASIDPRFGRAAQFVVYDVDTGAIETVDNTQNLQAAQGAGIQAAQNVANLGVECVLTGHCGPKAFRVLQTAGIGVIVGVDGTVGEAVERFKKGELKPTGAADVEGHWV